MKIFRRINFEHLARYNLDSNFVAFAIKKLMIRMKVFSTVPGVNKSNKSNSFLASSNFSFSSRSLCLSLVFWFQFLRGTLAQRCHLFQLMELAILFYCNFLELQYLQFLVFKQSRIENSRFLFRHPNSNLFSWNWLIFFVSVQTVWFSVWSIGSILYDKAFHLITIPFTRGIKS